MAVNELSVNSFNGSKPMQPLHVAPDEFPHDHSSDMNHSYMSEMAAGCFCYTWLVFAGLESLIWLMVKHRKVLLVRHAAKNVVVLHVERSVTWSRFSNKTPPCCRQMWWFKVSLSWDRCSRFTGAQNAQPVRRLDGKHQSLWILQWTHIGHVHVHTHSTAFQPRVRK